MSAMSLEDRARIEMDRDDELTGATGASPVNAPTHQLISKPVMVDSAGLLAAASRPANGCCRLGCCRRACP